MSRWHLQRLTAILLFPLLLWLLVALTILPDYHYPTLIHWLQSGSSLVLLAALALLFVLHSYLGVEEIITDYVHHPRWLKLSQRLLQGFMLLLLALVLFSLVSLL